MNRRVSILLLVLSCSAAAARGEITWTGDLDPEDPTTWTTSDDAYVGKTVEGSIAVTDGGTLLSDDSYLGFESGAMGTATVNGVGSQWENRGILNVGSSGTGTLNVEAGGHVSNDDGYVGRGTGSTGKVIVTGSGSEWNNDRILYVGQEGSGTILVAAGGKMTTRTGGYLGYYRNSTGAVTITGAGSQWTDSGYVSVGHYGSGTFLVTEGGMVEKLIGIVGDQSGSMGTATVSGDNSMWYIVATFQVGFWGSGTLLVEAGGQVNSWNSYVGYAANSKGDVAVTGAGSWWNNGAELYMGREGSASLTITHGGLVSIGRDFIIDENGDNDSYVDITTGGMLALKGEAEQSIDDFLDLVQGTDAIRYWSPELADWAPITEAVYGDDYTLEYLTTGDLAGYTVLTVGTVPTSLPGDFNDDGLVNLADYTVWRNHLGGSDDALINNAGDGLPGIDVADYEVWKSHFGDGNATAPDSVQVPEPSGLVLLTLVGLVGVSISLLSKNRR